MEISMPVSFLKISPVSIRPNAAMLVNKRIMWQQFPAKSLVVFHPAQPLIFFTWTCIYEISPTFVTVMDTITRMRYRIEKSEFVEDIVLNKRTIWKHTFYSCGNFIIISLVYCK